MKKIMFNDKFGLTEAVLNGTKTMTRRLIPCEVCNDILKATNYHGSNSHDIFTIENHSRYNIGDEVAIAQKYWDLRNDNGFYEALEKADPSFPLECIKGEKGCHNKMFVKASWMPHRIRITNIKIERLQDISDDDCLREGIYVQDNLPKGYAYDATDDRQRKRWWFGTPRKAFAALIDKVSGKGTWESNPFVFVYSFILIK